MIRNLFLLGAAVLSLGAAPAAHAPRPHLDPSLAGPTPTKLVGYLKKDDIDGRTVIGPPPAPDSPRGKADRTIYLDTRGLAGSPRWAQAVKDNDLWTGGALERFAA
ncbi:MAG TPA: phosphatase PAP2 family protein, partial [Phenylobacterium sp.]|nr:phosphatase PAP2 family protein [Phenylobacterium sp.]